MGGGKESRLRSGKEDGLSGWQASSKLGNAMLPPGMGGGYRKSGRMLDYKASMGRKAAEWCCHTGLTRRGKKKKKEVSPCQT